MASVLELFREILCKFRFTRGFFHRFFKRWVLFLAFLGRRLGTWRPWSDRGCSTFQKAECSSPGTTTRLESKKCGVAASYIPASASHPSLHNTSSTSQQPQPASSATPADPVEPPRPRDHANPSSAFESRIHSNRRSTDSSIRSRSSDRQSIIQAHPHESFYTPSSQPIQLPSDPLHQSGRGPSASPSRERPSRSPSPTDPIPQPRLEVDVTNLRPHTQVVSIDSLINPPLATPHADVQQNPPSVPGFHSRRSSTTSVIVGVENPSTGSLPHSFFTAVPLPVPEEPYTIEHISVVDILDLREGLSQAQDNPTTFTSDLDLSEGRILQLINSEQVPRYTKDATMPRERTYFEISPLTTTFLHSPLEQGSLQEDCAPWVPATHPDGALYFFDEDRVRASRPLQIIDCDQPAF
ncbi:hypothetical protein EDB85DRAFT_176931 [Lactarius pseudohatsudake]|nr:hypothetical protein EDB85DRAFT_176931 [Lactarius pseudohatsudake]